MRYSLLLAAAAAALAASSEPAAAGADSISLEELNAAPEVLYQLSPSNLKTVADGSKTVFAAFVNPYLPHSRSFHPVLHEINARFSGRSDVLVAFGDVSIHRQFIRQLGLKELPALFVFNRFFPSRMPASVEYTLNRTASDYVREINLHLHAADSLDKDAKPISAAVKELLVAAQRNELEAALEHAKQSKARKEAVEVAASGDAAPATAAPVEDAAAAAPANSTAVEEASSVVNSALLALQGELSKEIEYIEKLAAISKARLSFLNETLQVATDLNKGGIGYLAKQLNMRLQQLGVSSDLLNPEFRQQGLVQVGVLRRLLQIVAETQKLKQKK